MQLKKSDYITTYKKIKMGSEFEFYLSFKLISDYS